MPDSKDTIQRALELAESGEYNSVNHIRQQLRREDRLDVYTALRSAKINLRLVEILRRTSAGGAARALKPNII